MCQTPPWTKQNIIHLESTASQLLHQKSIDFNCKNGFQRGMDALQTCSPPQETVREKPPQKNRPHSCVVDPCAKKQTEVATCTYTIDVPDSTMDQSKQNWLGIRSITIASSKEHRFQLQKWFSKGGGCPSELCTPQEAVRKKTPQSKIGLISVEDWFLLAKI